MLNKIKSNREMQHKSLFSGYVLYAPPHILTCFSLAAPLSFLFLARFPLNVSILPVSGTLRDPFCPISDQPTTR